MAKLISQLKLLSLTLNVFGIGSDATLLAVCNNNSNIYQKFLIKLIIVSSNIISIWMMISHYIIEYIHLDRSAVLNHSRIPQTLTLTLLLESLRRHLTRTFSMVMLLIWHVNRKEIHKLLIYSRRYHASFRMSHNRQFCLIVKSRSRLALWLPLLYILFGFLGTIMIRPSSLPNALVANTTTNGINNSTLFSSTTGHSIQLDQFIYSGINNYRPRANNTNSVMPPIRATDLNNHTTLATNFFDSSHWLIGTIGVYVELALYNFHRAHMKMTTAFKIFRLLPKYISENMVKSSSSLATTRRPTEITYYENQTFIGMTSTISGNYTDTYVLTSAIFCILELTIYSLNYHGMRIACSTLVSLILHIHCDCILAFNSQLKSLVLNERKQQLRSAQLALMLRKYNLINDIHDMILKTFAWIIILWFSHMFVSCLVHIFAFAGSDLDKHSISSITYRLLSLIMLCYPSTIVYLEAVRIELAFTKTERLIMQLCRRNDDVVARSITPSLFASPDMSMAGYFNLDKNCMSSLLGAIITFSVMFIGEFSKHVSYGQLLTTTFIMGTNQLLPLSLPLILLCVQTTKPLLFSLSSFSFVLWCVEIPTLELRTHSAHSSHNGHQHHQSKQC